MLLPNNYPQKIILCVPPSAVAEAGWLNRLGLGNACWYWGSFLSFRRLGGRNTKLLSHQSAHLEFNRSLCSNLDSLQSLRILSNSSGSGLGLEDTKVPKFQTVTILTKFVCDLIKKCLNDALDDNSLGLCFFCNPIYEFFLCNRCHTLPRFSKEQFRHTEFRLYSEIQ